MGCLGGDAGRIGRNGSIPRGGTREHGPDESTEAGDEPRERYLVMRVQRGEEKKREKRRCGAKDVECYRTMGARYKDYI